MLDIMTNAKNAITAYNEALKATSSNIAGMNVTGYKRLDVSFQTIFENVLSQGSAAQQNMGGSNPLQFGSGTALSNVGIDFSSGEFVDGSPIDLGIKGQGMFVLSADGGNSYLYSRAGRFEIDSSGNLLSNNMQVYGLNSSGALVPIAGLPSGNKSDYSWDANGYLYYQSAPAGYQIALTYFSNPNGLSQAQGTSFAETPASGVPATPRAPDFTVGSLQTGQFEQSNVSYISETIDALELQRAMSGNLTMLNMASDMISQFISKLS